MVLLCFHMFACEGIFCNIFHNGRKFARNRERGLASSLRSRCTDPALDLLDLISFCGSNPSKAFNFFRFFFLSPFFF